MLTITSPYRRRLEVVAFSVSEIGWFDCICSRVPRLQRLFMFGCAADGRQVVFDATRSRETSMAGHRRKVGFTRRLMRCVGVGTSVSTREACALQSGTPDSD